MKFITIFKNSEIEAKQNDNKMWVKIKFKQQFNKWFLFTIKDLKKCLSDDEKPQYLAAEKFNSFKKQDYFLVETDNNKLVVKMQINNHGLWNDIIISKESLALVLQKTNS